MGDKKIPKAVWEGQFVIGGVTLNCVVLEDGQRVINGADLEELFEKMGSKDFAIKQEEVDSFARWQKGQNGNSKI